MKILTLFLCIAISSSAFAKKKDSINVVYSRSSLSLFLLEEDKMPQKDVIIEAFKTAPFPDKFNNHNIAVRTFNADSITITDEDYTILRAQSTSGNSNQKKAGGSLFGNLVKSVVGQASGGVIGTDSKESFAAKSNKYFIENKIAKQVLDKWFITMDSTQTPSFSTDLIFERGLYGASQAEVEKAKQSVLGTNLLKDSGFELLNNSFVIACRYRYMSKDELVAMIDAIATSAAKMTGNEIAQLAVSAAMIATKASLGAGYYVVTNSYLFQLDWNDDVANKIYGTWDKLDDYNALDVAKLNYIGNETAWANVKAGIFTNKNEAELIHIATINSTDAVITKLEKKYDVFKTKTPLIVNEDGTMVAHIGLKEGLSAKDKFEVLEKIQGEDGKISYKRKGVITVAKNKIWDNRYMADQEPTHDASITATSFDGFKKDFFTGMLIRQMK